MHVCFGKVRAVCAGFSSHWSVHVVECTWVCVCEDLDLLREKDVFVHKQMEPTVNPTRPATASAQHRNARMSTLSTHPQRAMTMSHVQQMAAASSRGSQATSLVARQSSVHPSPRDMHLLSGIGAQAMQRAHANQHALNTTKQELHNLRVALQDAATKK